MSTTITTGLNTGAILTTGPYLTSSANNLIWSTDTALTVNTAYYGSIDKSIKKIKPLENLYYSVVFEIDKDEMLKKNVCGIRKNKVLFNCDFVNNRIQPYEFIMRLIDDKKQFSVKIKVSSFLTINYYNFRFIRIENNLDFNNSTCNFSNLKVKFKYDKMEYENSCLSPTQLRSDKMKKIIKNEENI